MGFLDWFAKEDEYGVLRGGRGGRAANILSHVRKFHRLGMLKYSCWKDSIQMKESVTYEPNC